MNPLTLVKRIQSMNSKEASLGISDEASWHAKYKDSAYVFVGGIPFDLTEGDLLAIFAQYGEIVDVNLVRDKGTGKSKGFSFVAYEDQRSTNLAVGIRNISIGVRLVKMVRCIHWRALGSIFIRDALSDLKQNIDNLNGAQILGRTIRVDHCSKYKKKEEEDEEAEQKKREERGVCRAFQKGECTRGAGCKFSHDEQRAANTGWGADDKTSTWGHDKYEGGQRRGDRRPSRPEHTSQEGFRSNDKDSIRPYDQSGRTLKVKGDDEDNRGRERRSEWKEKSMDRDIGKKSTRHEFEETSCDADRREATRSSRHKSGSYPREEQDSRGGDKSSSRSRDNSSHQFREEDKYRKLDR